MAATFWKSAKQEPKRAYRWYISFSAAGFPDLMYAAKRVDKPSISISESEHTYLNHKYYYPGRVDWSEVSVSFVDVVGADGAADAFLKALSDAGYTIPDAASADQLVTLGKSAMHDQIGDVIIRQVNANGNEIEAWTLKNAWFKSVKVGSLDYGSEELLSCDVSIRYDYATYERTTAGASGNETGDVSTLQGTTLWGDSDAASADSSDDQ